MKRLGPLIDMLVLALPSLLLYAAIWGAGLGPIRFHP
jgi:hypothetical protein